MTAESKLAEWRAPLEAMPKLLAIAKLADELCPHVGAVLATDECGFVLGTRMSVRVIRRLRRALDALDAPKDDPEEWGDAVEHA